MALPRTTWRPGGCTHWHLRKDQRCAQATELLNRLEETIGSECPLLGKQVRITGTSRGDLNGRVGVARSFDEATGRYVYGYVEGLRGGAGARGSRSRACGK